MESLVYRGHIKSWDWLRPFREQILIKKRERERGSKGGGGGERRGKRRRGNSRGLSHDKMERSCCGRLFRWQISQHVPVLVERGENLWCTRKENK